MCEEYLEMEGMKNPIDYKFYCFNGRADFIQICSEREKSLRLDYYDLNWNPLNYSTEEYKSGNTFKRPTKLNEMIKIAEDLSEGFPYVRVDLYEINDKIYFGELTLTPAAGNLYYCTQEALDILGSKLKLPFEK